MGNGARWKHAARKMAIAKVASITTAPGRGKPHGGFDGRVEGDKVRDPTKYELIVVGCAEGCPALIQHPSKSKCI